MNKKVDEEFIGIKDAYALQCLATEMKVRIVKAIEVLEKNIEKTKKGDLGLPYEIMTLYLLDILKGSDTNK